MPEAKGSDFQVKLGGLELPAETERKIAVGIREVVMQELARIDFKGDLRIRPGLTIGPRTLGMWIDLQEPGRDR